MMEYMYPDINVFLLSLKDFYDKELAEAVISTINSYGEGFMPQKYDLYEPLKRKYSVNSFNDVVALWMNETVNQRYREKGEKIAAGQVIMQRKKGHELGYFIDWDKGKHSFNLFSFRIAIDFLKKGDNYSKFVEFCVKLINLIEPAYGYVCNYSFPNHSEPINLEVRMPEIQWGLILGKPYIEMFTEEKILACPCYKVVELENTMLLQATENIFEEVPKNVKEIMKRHLGENAFVWDGKSNRYYTKQENMVPKFDFSNIMFP